MQPGDKDDGQLPDAAAILDAVIDLVAEEEAENGEPTEEDIRWSRDVRRQIEARIAELRHQLDRQRLQAAGSAVIPGGPPDGDRELTPVEPAELAAPMRDDSHALHALDREALLARLQALHPPGVHPDLASLRDEDLRRMLARLTGPTEGETP